MKKNAKLTTRLGSAVTAGLISTALIATPLTTLVSATPAIAEVESEGQVSLPPEPSSELPPQEETKLPPEGTKTPTEQQKSQAVAMNAEGFYFGSLQEALTASPEGKVTLLKDTDEHIVIDNQLKVTLDLNGQRIAHNNNDGAIVNGGTLNIIDKKGGGSVFGIKAAISNDQGGSLVIDGGTYEGAIENSGTLVITGGTFKDPVNNSSSTGKFELKVEGGTFANDVTPYVEANQSVIGLKSDEKTTYAVSSDGNEGGYIDNLVNTAKSGDTITVTQVANDGKIQLDLSDIDGVTVINNSKGKVALSGIVLDPGEYSRGDQAVAAVSMHRLYNPNSGEHFYTASTPEHDFLVTQGWRDEGIGWTAPSISTTPVYRLYNPNAGDHHYTISRDELNFLVSAGWRYEGIGWYSDDAQTVPLYRQYNPNAKAGAHNFTTSKAENDHLVSVGWRAEDIGWYGIKAAK